MASIRLERGEQLGQRGVERRGTLEVAQMSSLRDDLETTSLDRLVHRPRLLGRRYRILVSRDDQCGYVDRFERGTGIGSRHHGLELPDDALDWCSRHGRVHELGDLRMSLAGRLAEQRSDLSVRDAGAPLDTRSRDEVFAPRQSL